MAREGVRLTAQAFQQMGAARRYTMLVATLRDLEATLTDAAIGMFGSLVGRANLRARKRLEPRFAPRRGVSVPALPSVRRELRPSAFRYWMRYDLAPLGFSRTPKPRSSLSQVTTSRSGTGRRLSTTRLVSFGIIRSSTTVCLSEPSLPVG